jgi:nitrite reductase/ring-hydroxylating ferredoxin subunit/uncharacterized membrane protein
MHRQVAALIDRQARWADPVGDNAQEILAQLLNQRRQVKNLLNGTWLGHPVHPAVTDVPVGAMTVASLLDVTGQDAAADLALATGLAGMVASAVTGSADAVDAYGESKRLATVHGTLMTASASAYLLSLLLRVGPRAGRPLARLLGLVGYGALSAGAYVGGELTYRTGNQVDRHAFERGGGRWEPLDVAEVPQGTLVRAKAGPDPIVLHRVALGDPISAIHAICAHAGGPLHKGTIVDGCVECPWHQSRFELATGHVRQGPAVYDQPRFEVREAALGGLEARRMPSGAQA